MAQSPSPEDGPSTRLYDSTSEDEPASESKMEPDNEAETASRPHVSSTPLHPMRSFQGAFGESIIESIDAASTTKQVSTLNPKQRRQKMLEQEDYDETYSAQWRRNPEAKFHPLWKLMAQISFGVHLLQQQLAKSDEEVVKILQKHVDEVDAFLERTTEDFEVSNQDIKERTNHLKLPLEHINIFDVMLDDQKFRSDIMDGNRKIELILTRTGRALKDSLIDVKTGMDCVTELSAYLVGIREQMSASDVQTSSIYHAMKSNTEGWSRALHNLQGLGNDLGQSLGKLGHILREMSVRAEAASKRAVSHRVTLTCFLIANRLTQVSRYQQSSRVPSNRSTRPTSPAMSAPTSKYSSARSANAHGKPLPPPPRSDTANSLRLETPNMAASRPDSRSHSPLQSPTPHSPALQPHRNHSPLASPTAQRSFQVPSPLAGSPRPASPSTSSGYEPSPFEGRFESVRAAPKPPGRRSNAGDGVTPLSKVTSATSSMRASSIQHSRSSSVTRSGSIIKRLRRNLSRDSKNDDRPSQPPQQRAAPQKHERSMTSDLADLMQVTGVNDETREPVAQAAPTSPLKRSKGISRMGSLRSSKTVPAVLRKKSLDTRPLESPAPDSAYAASEKQPYPDPDDLENINMVVRRKSLNRYLGDETLVRTLAPPTRSRAKPAPQKRSMSPGLPRPLTPLSQLDESDEDTTPRASTVPPEPEPQRPASPVSLVQPSPLPTSRPHSPSSTLGRPQTPTQRSKFGLFPSNRPMTPSAMSYTSEAPSLASPAKGPQAVRPLNGERWALDDELPAPSYARPRAESGYSNSSNSMFKGRELVGGATIVSNRDEKRKGGFGRFKNWVSGKRDTGGSKLRP